MKISSKLLKAWSLKRTRGDVSRLVTYVKASKPTIIKAINHGEVKDNFAILTTAANSLMSQVHNSKMRMPTILTDELANEWTEPILSEERITAIATNQYPSEHMTAHSVAKEFLQNTNPEEPFIYETLEALV